MPRDIRRAQSVKITTTSEKGLVSTSRTYASPKGMEPGVWRSKRPLSACHNRRKCSMGPLKIDKDVHSIPFGFNLFLYYASITFQPFTLLR